MSGSNHTGQRGQAQEQCSQVTLGFHCCVGAVRGNRQDETCRNRTPELSMFFFRGAWQKAAWSRKMDEDE